MQNAETKQMFRRKSSLPYVPWRAREGPGKVS